MNAIKRKKENEKYGCCDVAAAYRCNLKKAQPKVFFGA